MNSCDLSKKKRHNTSLCMHDFSGVCEELRKSKGHFAWHTSGANLPLQIEWLLIRLQISLYLGYTTWWRTDVLRLKLMESPIVAYLTARFLDRWPYCWGLQEVSHCWTYPASKWYKQQAGIGKFIGGFPGSTVRIRYFTRQHVSRTRLLVLSTQFSSFWFEPEKTKKVCVQGR